MLIDRIKTARKNAGLKQFEMAEQIGVTRAFYNRVENGNQTPSQRTLKDIARVTNVNYDWLETGDGEMYSPTIDIRALVASELLDNTDSELLELIVDIVKVYKELPTSDRAVIDKLVRKLKEG